MHECRKAMNMPRKPEPRISSLVSKVKRSLDRQHWLSWSGRCPLKAQVLEPCKKPSTPARLNPISLLVSAVGEPYWGKPDVRFDEGDQRTESW